jgi:hypothetical protein
MNVDEFKVWLVGKQVGHSKSRSDACLGGGDIETSGSVTFVRDMTLGSAETRTRDEHLCTPVFCPQKKLLPVKLGLSVLVPPWKGLGYGCDSPSFERLQ